MRMKLYEGGYIDYIRTGRGRDVLLLHGNGQSRDIFREGIDVLESRFTVYALDLPGHGRSSYPGNADYSILAGLIHEFILKTGMDRPFLYGFSDGGILGLILASRYPDLFSGLVVSGVNIGPEGFKGLYRMILRAAYRFTGSWRYEMMLKGPYMTVEELKLIKVPVFVTAGQRDFIKKEHIQLISENIENCRFHVMKCHNHRSYVVHSTLFAQYVMNMER